MLHVTNSLIFYVCAALPFGFEGGMWDLIVLNPDHCFSISLVSGQNCGYQRKMHYHY